MLVQKLDPNDLQFEKMSPFDGTLAYAQNKRQQIVMTDQLSKQYPGIQFTSMHPGSCENLFNHRKISILILPV